MSTTHTPPPDDTVYTILISEQQRRVMHAALKAYNRTPCCEIDKWGNSVPDSLEVMLNPEGATGPLITKGINSFVV